MMDHQGMFFPCPFFPGKRTLELLLATNEPLPLDSVASGKCIDSDNLCECQ